MRALMLGQYMTDYISKKENQFVKEIVVRQVDDLMALQHLELSLPIECPLNIISDDNNDDDDVFLLTNIKSISNY